MVMLFVPDHCLVCKIIHPNAMFIDTSFNVHSDSKGRDPDLHSPTLRGYHKQLWSKSLPNGKGFELTEMGKYLGHQSPLGTFYLGSDAITHSYQNHERKKWLTLQIPAEVQELRDLGSTVGACTVFPNYQIQRQHTINQARGISAFIDDRFDLTLECIRLFYAEHQSPLFDVFKRYQDFFDLFGDFEGYVHFFLLDDLLDGDGKVKFYLPFTDFNSRPGFKTVDDYLLYKEGVMAFIHSRNRRIEAYCASA